MKQSTRSLNNSATLETLEDRRLMTATPFGAISLNAGVLTLTGDAKLSTRINLDFGSDQTHLVAQAGNHFQTFTTGSIRTIKVTAGDGNDYVYINSKVTAAASIKLGNGNDVVRSGAGNDTIVVGNGNDIIFGKGGNNSITAGSGNDTLMGDRGNDTLVAGNGNDSLVGGGGLNTTSAGTGTDTFQFSSAHDVVTAGGHTLKLGGLTNGYLYAKGGTQTNLPAPVSTAPPVVTAPAPVSTPVSTPAPVTTPVAVPTGGVQSTGTSPEAAGPVAVIITLAGVRETGLGVNFDGLASTIHAGTAIDSRYAWDFGDAGSRFDQTTGFNGAHVYDTPGTYTVTLTVTDENGLSSTATQTVSIAASTRRQVFVDPVNGSDANAGTQAAPYKSLAAATAKIGDGTEVLLKAGERFDLTTTITPNASNVVFGRYGSGVDPVINRIKENGFTFITAGTNTNGLTIQHIQFDTPYVVGADGAAPKVGVSGIYIGGQNTTVRNCTFLNLDDAINENENPTGVLIQDNSCPLLTGLRGYMIWAQGKQQVVQGNYAANSTREDIVRAYQLTEVAFTGNTFTNADRGAVDDYDGSKGCIEMQWGSYGWIVGNTVTGGDIRVGPLGLWGESPTSAAENCVIQDNQLTDTFVSVQSGTHHAMIRNNVILFNNGAALQFSGVDGQGRTSSDITIANNTAFDNGTTGNFIHVGGWVSGIVMKNNAWIAPNINMGGGGTAPVYVDYTDLSGFTSISENVWPAPKIVGTWTAGGLNLVGTNYQPADFYSPAQWDSLPNVHGDVVEEATLNDSYQISFPTFTAGSSLKMAA